MGHLKLVVLGSGDAFGSGGRRQSAYLLETDRSSMLLDCGTSVLAAMKEANRSTEKIDVVWVSHLHGDHFAGLPFLLLEYVYEQPRERELLVVGPRGVEDRVWQLFRGMYLELAERALPFPLRFQEFTANEPVSWGSARVTPLPVPHQLNEPSFALLVEVEGKTVLYSGDTKWTDDLVLWSQGVDLFVCECTYWQNEAPVHVNYADLSKNLRRLGAKRVLLSHLGREVLEHLEQLEAPLATDGLVLEL